MLVAFPLRCEWDALCPPAPKSYPAPLDMPRPEEPGPVAGLALLAGALGWTVRVTYSRGHVPHATHGTPGAQPKDIWAVRCARGSRRAVAVRHADSWDALWVWSDTEFFRKIPYLEEFQGRLE